MKLAALLLTALLLAGCSADSSDSTSSPASTGDSAGGSAEGSAGGDTAAPPGAAPLTGQPGKGAGPAPVQVQGRVTPASSVIRTGELEVVVEDVPRAADEASRLVQDAGGQVEADDRTRDGGDQQATLRLRVPPDAFDTTVGRLAGLGTERARRLGSEDVTEQVVDLDSRLATQRASVERVRALLSQAKNLGEVVQVEAELTRRTADLESLQARLAALTARVDLGTIELRLSAEGSPAATGGAPGFRDGLREGWEALQAAGRAVGVTVGALLPWSPVLLVVGLLVWRSRRRTAV